MGSVLVFFF